jgi:hypothetical protein
MNSILSRRNSFNSTYVTSFTGDYEEVKSFASVQISALLTQNATLTLYFSDDRTNSIYTTDISLVANVEYFNSFIITNRYFKIGLNISISTNVKIDTKYLQSPISNKINLIETNNFNNTSFSIHTSDVSGTTEIPSNAYFIIIRAVGGGGGGGSKGNSNDAGGGGGSSGYIELYLNESDFKTNSFTDISYNIGIGGAEGATGGTTTVSLYKSNMESVLGTVLGGTSGAGGNNFAAGGGGGKFTINSPYLGWGKTGNPGKYGYDAGATNAVPISGNGGDSMLGPGGRATPAYFPTDGGSVGIAGGGGGGGVYANSTNWVGKAGGNGRVIIIFFKRN